jgi:hypothetical protein
MSRASVIVLLLASVLVVACYYDESKPDLGTAGTKDYITNLVSIEMVQQPIEFKFTKEDDVTDDTTTEDTADLPCKGVDCEKDDKVCHPTADVCVNCYTGELTDPGCDADYACYVDAEDPAKNYCEPL